MSSESQPEINPATIDLGAFRDERNRRTEVWIAADDVDGQRRYTGRIQWVEHHEGDRGDPLISIGHREDTMQGVLQRFVNELWDAGIRPAQAEAGLTTITATQRHLDDMRAIVAKQLKLTSGPADWAARPEPGKP